LISLYYISKCCTTKHHVHNEWWSFWSSRQSLALVRTTKIHSRINQTNTKS